MKDINEVLAKRLKDQIGELTFQVLLKDAVIEQLQEENKSLKESLIKMSPDSDKKEG